MLVSIIVFAITLALDLISKYAVCAVTRTGEVITVIPKVLSFTYSENRGASFGIFSDKTLLLTIITAIIVVGLIAYFIIARKNMHKLMSLSLALIISGALGNLYDRIVFGYVRDFIDYEFIELITKQDFAICNFADLVLIVGAVLMAVYALFFYDKHYRSLHPESEPQKASDVDIALTEPEKVDNLLDNDYVAKPINKSVKVADVDINVTAPQTIDEFSVDDNSSKNIDEELKLSDEDLQDVTDFSIDTNEDNNSSFKKEPSKNNKEKIDG